MKNLYQKTATLLASAALGLMVSFTSMAEDEASTAASALGVYGAAWNQTSPDRMQALLDISWAETGTYTDPTTSIRGRAALLKYIREFQALFPGAQLVWTSRVDAHHGQFRVSWSIVGVNGKAELTGQDFGEMDEDGRIKSIVGFFDPSEIQQD